MTNNVYDRRHFIGTVTGGMLGATMIQNVSAQNSNTENIEIVFAGTGAADWPSKYPAPGQHISRGGFRGNASIILDSAVMIDCGPTVPDSLAFHNIGTGSLSDLFITHSHGDHINKDSLGKISKMTEVSRKISIRGNASALERATPPDSFDIKSIDCMETVHVAGLDVTALPANHVVADSEEIPLHYLIVKGNKRILYATDGAWLLKPTWLYLREKPLDAVIWDATIGNVTGDWRIFEHNSLAMIRLMIETMRMQNVLKQGARNILTHMARTLWESHEKIEKALTPEGIEPAWDGMRIVV